VYFIGVRAVLIFKGVVYMKKKRRIVRVCERDKERESAECRSLCRLRFQFKDDEILR